MRSFFKHPKLLLTIILIVTVFFALQLPEIRISNDVLSFIPKNHKEVVNYDKVKNQFGSDLVIDVALEATHGTIFKKDFLLLVKKLTDTFKSIPGVVSVDSISSTDIITGTAEGMEVHPLLENFTGSKADITALKTKLLSWNIYKGLLYSKDFTSTQIGVKIDPDIQSEAMNKVYFAIEKELKKINTDDVRYYVAGMPAITVLITSQMKKDIVFLIPLVVLVVIGTLYLSFRRLGGVILPLTTVLISGIWTIGLMALFGVPLSLLATVIPVILVAVGSAYGIHIVSHYYDELDRASAPLTEEQHREIVFGTLKRIGLPVFLAGLTTLIGFGSLISSTVIPMKTFGIFTAIGVVTSLAVALVFIPSILLLRHKALKHSQGTGKTVDITERFMNYLYGIFHRNKGRIIFITLLITIAGIYGTTKVIKDNILVNYFKPNTEIQRADRFLRQKFNGTTTFDIIVKGDKKGSLTNPEILIAMDDLSTYLKGKYPEVTNILSFTDFVKKMNEVMNSTPPPPAAAPVPQQEKNTEQTEPSGGFTSFFTETPAPPENSVKSSAKNPAQNTGLAPTAAPSSSDFEPLWKTMGKNFSYEDFLTVLNRAYIQAQQKNMSAAELVAAINRELNYNGAAYYEIPSNPAKYSAESMKELQNLISQYLLLFSGELSDWTDDNLEPSMAKMFVQINTPGTILPHRIARDAEAYARAHFPKGYTVETVGTSKIMYALTQLITTSQTRSILISLLLVFIILTINYRSLLAGIIGIIPISLTVLINFGIMGLLHIRLDISTAMVSAVSIGIGIDYTIHYLSYYHYERSQSDNLEQVARSTLQGVGKAIIFNAVSVAGGFLVMLLSNFTPLNYFGLLVALTMITSSTASLTLLPILLEIIKPRFIYKEKTT